MANLLYDTSTPCPLRLRTSRTGRSCEESVCDNELEIFDTTRNVEFTPEIRAPVLAGARPKRRNKGAPSFRIHEDGDDKKKDNVDNGRSINRLTTTSNRKLTLLAQPAQRYRSKECLAPNPLSQLQQPQSKPRNTNEEGNGISPKHPIGKDHESLPKDIYKRAVRRNTVYIPPDDTTVPSVFMGLFSPLKSQNITDHQVLDDTQINSLEARIARKRLAKKSSSTFSRRAPLQSSATIPRENATPIDIPGKNGGKENIPPGDIIGFGGKKGKPENFDETLNDIQKSDKTSSAAKPSFQSNRVHIKNEATAAKLSSIKGTALSNRRSLASPLTVATNSRRNTGLKKSLATKEKALPINRSSTPGILSKITIPNLARRGLNVKYPLLTEDISNPSMYEDNWLMHQEIGITQLVNGLFEFAHGSSYFQDPDTLRHELLRIYQTDAFTQLHRRLQTSLLYGSLSIPKDTLTQNNRIKHDVGLKKKFLDIWLRVYDLPSLRAAAETVLGRRIALPEEGLNGLLPVETSKDKGRILERELEAFLDTFLLRNEDIDRATAEPLAKGVDADAASGEYVRTILRSVMIIVLLDAGKSSPGTALPHRLFVSSSPYKSSAAVLQALGRLLLPSSGNIIRPLGQLDCHVHHEQHQLQEYGYQMDNLAVDLRDGVRLARIVEILLYPSTSCFNSNYSGLDGSTTTLTMSNGKNISISNKECNWPLSEHLKFPCRSRAAKLFNVQVSLEALSSTNSAGIVNTISAEDIVDGHREKTIALLWGLVSKWGLVGLVDWDGLKKEIRRLKRKAVSLAGAAGYEKGRGHDWLDRGEIIEEPVEEHACLLKQWASILAESKGLHLTNLTTCFADGKIYESIVNEYEGYILESGNSNSNNKSVGRPLWSRLQALGCSPQFAYLVSPKASALSHIFDRDFTITSLAFLCSRLLSASKGPRAAVVLQRTWRRILGRRNLERRTIARNLARQCAAVVQTEDRILWAKFVILKWWRNWRATTQQQQRRNRQQRTSRPGKKGLSARRLRDCDAQTLYA